MKKFCNILLIVFWSTSEAATFVWPVTPEDRAILGNDYAEFDYVIDDHFHTALDIGVPENTIVRAAYGGKIIRLDMSDKWGGDNHNMGHVVIIDHSNEGIGHSLFTLYAHLKEITVADKTDVIRGQPIAKSGSTGGNYDPHLHFEVKTRAVLHNPLWLGNETPEDSTENPCGDPVCHWGYLPANAHPDISGYIDPVLFLHDVTRLTFPMNITIQEDGVSIRVGPGGEVEKGEYRIIGSVNNGEQYLAIAHVGATVSPGCTTGWLQIENFGESTFFKDHNKGTNAQIPDAWICADYTDLDLTSFVDQRARTDIEARTEFDDRFGGAIAGSFGKDLDQWSTDWELRWMDYIFSGDRTVRIFHAMSKKYGTVRYTTYYDPDSENWTEWVLALDYESADQQAIEDMEVMFKDDSRFIGIVAGTFGKDLDQWSTDWELRWMEFLYIGNRTVTVFHATSKSIPSLRAINYFNPDASAWVDWVLVE